MNSILRQINQNIDNKSRKELMETYLNLMDAELNKTYSNTDCVHNYRQNFIKFKQNSRQYYQCSHNLCQFSTNKSSLIVRHIRRHLKQKPYLCPIDGCRHQFYQKCDLRCHLMRHFENKPFICNYKNCDKSYTTRKALSLHIKTHSPLGFSCKECHKMFATNWKLNKHLKDIHKSIVNSSVEDNRQLNPNPDIKVESKTIESNFNSINEIKVEPNIESVVKPKNNSEFNSLTEQLIHSINSVNEQIKDNILSKDNFNTFSSEFGFEEVIKYVITNCGNTSNGQTIVGNANQMTSLKPLDRAINQTNSNPESIRSDSNQTPNILFRKSVENICSLIEIYRHDSTDRKRKVLYKCFECVYTSDTIQVIVGHVLEHMSEGLTQSLRNKTI